MEISVRDWMIIIGILLIVAVLLDGYRRMRDPSRIRMSLTRAPEGEGDEDVTVSRELPGGGARVKPRPAPGQADGGPPAGPEGDTAEEMRADPAVTSESFGEAGTAAEPPFLTEPAAERSRIGRSADPDPLFDDPGPGAAGQPFVAPGENLDLLEGITADSRDELPPDRGGAAPEAEEVLILHVVARGEAGFPGEDILQVLLAYNLRFGEMNFFHRHEESAGRGAIQFSVANMLNPGVFDIDGMSDFSTTGLIFFLTLPGPRDMMGAFELMVETAQGVAQHLGGDVLDESRSALTRQTLEHMRQRIRDLERKLLAQARR